MLLDRTGKGIRTAPRDAMISLSASPATLGTAFGVHRALDTTGAMLGPLVAFGLLALAPLAFESVFLVSFCVALVGVAVLVLFVDGRPERAAPAAPAEPPPSLREAGSLLRVPGFARLIVVGSVLGLATLSDGFLYLALERAGGLRAHGLPAALRGHGRRLHAARGARGAARRPRGPRARCSWAATRCSSCSTA